MLLQPAIISNRIAFIRFLQHSQWLNNKCSCTREIVKIISYMFSGRPPPAEATTVIFRQPDDEIPRTKPAEPESIIGKLLVKLNSIAATDS